MMKSNHQPGLVKDSWGHSKTSREGSRKIIMIIPETALIKVFWIRMWIICEPHWVGAMKNSSLLLLELVPNLSPNGKLWFLIRHVIRYETIVSSRVARGPARSFMECCFFIHSLYLGRGKWKSLEEGIYKEDVIFFFSITIYYMV